MPVASENDEASPLRISISIILSILIAEVIWISPDFHFYIIIKYNKSYLLNNRKNLKF